jgi:hypothetical protein
MVIRMAKWKRGGFFAAVIGTAIVVYAIFFGYYTRTETFWLTYFPDDTYQPASNLPNVDGQGQPKVVGASEKVGPDRVL